MFRSAPARAQPAAIVALTALIFAVDAFTRLDIAIAVLYVVVVVLAANVWRRRGVLATSAACLLLTAAAFLVSHDELWASSAFGRCLVSLAAIGITALLAVARLDATDSLHGVRQQLAHATRVTTLGELAASIAHEVNQPLAAISANGNASLRWINRAEPELEEARQAIAHMLDDTRRASEVIRRIRALAHKGELRHAALDLNAAAEDAARLLRRELSAHAVGLTLALAPGLPAIGGDRIQLQQVIINLLINAMQAIGRGGQVELGTALAADGRVLLTVSDSGPGIPAAELPQLFEAFYTTKDDGMGMGLAICRSIVEAHGGRIRALSKLPPGATFEIALPPLAPPP
jgi:signal transduction histidine kinase